MSKHPRGDAAGVFAVWRGRVAVVGCLRLEEGSDCREFFALWRGAASVRFFRFGGGRVAAAGVCVGRGGVLMHFTPSQVALGWYLRVSGGCVILCV